MGSSLRLCCPSPASRNLQRKGRAFTDAALILWGKWFILLRHLYAGRDARKADQWALWFPAHFTMKL
jgi:hypothetical protein